MKRGFGHISFFTSVNKVIFTISMDMKRTSGWRSGGYKDMFGGN